MWKLLRAYSLGEKKAVSMRDFLALCIMNDLFSLLRAVSSHQSDRRYNFKEKKSFCNKSDWFLFIFYISPKINIKIETIYDSNLSCKIKGKFFLKIENAILCYVAIFIILMRSLILIVMMFHWNEKLMRWKYSHLANGKLSVISKRSNLRLHDKKFVITSVFSARGLHRKLCNRSVSHPFAFQNLFPTPRLKAVKCRRDASAATFSAVSSKSSVYFFETDRRWKIHRLLKCYSAHNIWSNLFCTWTIEISVLGKYVGNYS